MTKLEKQRIRRAVNLLMGEETYMLEAIGILAPMCGLSYPASDALRKAKLRVSPLPGYANAPAQGFTVRVPVRSRRKPDKTQNAGYQG
jgi:hypothetical protein